MICPKCGKYCPDDSKFCDGCGNCLVPNNVPQDNFQQPNNLNQPQDNYQQPSNLNQPQDNYQQPSNLNQPQDNYQQSNNINQPQNNFQQPYNINQPQNNFQQPNNVNQPQSNYQQPNNFNSPVQPNVYSQQRLPMIKNRSIALSIILTLITCGIYGIYWYYTLVEDLNVASNRPDDTSGGMVILFTILTCGIYGIYWMYKAGEKVAYIKKVYHGIQNSNDSIIYLVLDIVGLGIVSYALIQNELNKVAAI